jgi:hypothetical protein
MAKGVWREFVSHWWLLSAIVIILGTTLGYAGALYDSYYTSHHKPALPLFGPACNNPKLNKPGSDNFWCKVHTGSGQKALPN